MLSQYAVTLEAPHRHNPEVKVVVIDTINWSAAQQGWLERQLGTTREPFLIVMGHYPVYSSGPYGDVMAPTILPTLLETYGVTAYISGHEASLQHNVVNGVNYFSSGSFGETPTATTYRPGVSQYHESINGFLACAARKRPSTTAIMVCEFRDCDNNILHSVTLPERTGYSAHVPPDRCVDDTLVLSGPDVAALETATEYLKTSEPDFTLLS